MQMKKNIDEGICFFVLFLALGFIAGFIDLRRVCKKCVNTLILVFSASLYLLIYSFIVLGLYENDRILRRESMRTISP